jgi:hypothetical protein
MGGKQREIDTDPVPGGAERKGVGLRICGEVAGFAVGSSDGLLAGLAEDGAAGAAGGSIGLASGWSTG